MVLLYSLNEIRNKFDLILNVIHINHQLRTESTLEAEFVNNECNKMNIPFFLKEIVVLQANKIGVQAAAREERYKAFFKIMKQTDSHFLATGHNRDDICETALIRLIQGTSLTGLSGMKSVNNNIIRPIINHSRKEVLQYAKYNSIKFITDSSNKKLIYLRNRIRNKLLPELEINYNQNIKQTINRTIKSLQIDESFLQKHTDKTWEKLWKSSEKGFEVLIKDLLKLDEAIRIRTLIKAYYKVATIPARFEQKYITDIMSLINNQKGTKQIQLSGDVNVTRIYEILVFFNQQLEPAMEINNTPPFVLDVPGKNEFNSKNIVCLMYKNNSIEFDINNKDNNVEYFDFDELNLPLNIRSPQNGDRLQPFGLEGSVKLKNILINNKVPKEKRGFVNLICDSNNNIIWITKIRRSNLAKVMNKTNNILEIRIENQ